MTESTHEERVQESGVVGHSYDTDDRIGDLDIYEALVNPHDEQGAGAKKGGVGGPMMMPMGAGAAAGSTGTGSGVPGTSASGVAAKGASAAAAGTGSAGFGGTGGAGVSGFGGAGIGTSGLGASGLAGAGAGLSGLGSGPGSVSLPSGTGPTWGSPSFGTGAAGLTDPTGDVAGTGTDPSGGFTVPTVPTTPTPAVPSPTGPGTVATSPSPIHVPTTPIPSAGGIKAPTVPGGSGVTVPSAGGAGGGGGGARATTADLGVKTVTASPEMLHQEAQHWDDTAHQFAADVTNPVGNLAPSSVDFGMMKDAFAPYNDLLSRLKKWSTEAGTEFSSISEALQSASGGYTDTEATNTATATQTGLDRPE